jgi:hypothetical protein
MRFVRLDLIFWRPSWRHRLGHVTSRALGSVGVIDEQLARRARGSGDVITGSIRDWRAPRLLEKLEAAARLRPPAAVDLSSRADQVFTVFEAGFILTRAMDEPVHLPSQLAPVRHYLELLFGLPTGPPERGRRAAT